VHGYRLLSRLRALEERFAIGFGLSTIVIGRKPSGRET
jgi:hypothetical protein